MKITLRRPIFSAFIMGIGLLLIYFFAIILWRSESRYRLNNGALVEVKCDSIWDSVEGGRCRIDIQTPSGRKGHIVLNQDYFDGLLTILPTTRSNIFFCVYDYETNLELLKINLNEPFQNPSEGFEKSNFLESNCWIERIKTSDTEPWAMASKALREMSPKEYQEQVRGIDLIFYTLSVSQQRLSRDVQNYGNEWR